MENIKTLESSAFSTEQLSEFIREIFDEFIAADFSEEGVLEFYKYISPEKMKERHRNHFFLFAVDNNDQLSGLMEIRDNKHIALMFIKKEMQRKGIGKKLLSAAIEKCRKENPSLEKITVHSGANSLEAYKGMGFLETDQEKVSHGIRYTPMELKIS